MDERTAATLVIVGIDVPSDRTWAFSIWNPAPPWLTTSAIAASVAARSRGSVTSRTEDAIRSTRERPSSSQSAGLTSMKAPPGVPMAMATGACSKAARNCACASSSSRCVRSISAMCCVTAAAIELTSRATWRNSDAPVSTRRAS